jgi:hypothetical protein
VFEAVGVVFQEVRHSDFLAFLLDPRGQHGLGDRFTRGWLQLIVATVRGDTHNDNDSAASSVSPELLERVERVDLSGARVYREQDRIDIQLVDPTNRLVVVVENKIFSGEHSDQLARYFQIVEERYPDFDHLCIFLTPSGETPSHDRYVAADYGGICEEVESILGEGVVLDGRPIDQEVHFALSHYARLLRRNIVADTETMDLARRLYLEHRNAFELVYAHRFSHQKRLREVLIGLIEKRPDFVYREKVGSPPNEWLVFHPKDWNVPVLRHRREDQGGGLVINFVFDNLVDRLNLKLQFGGDKEMQGRLLEMAREDPELFSSSPIPNPQGLITIWRVQLLTREDYLEGTYSDLEQRLRERWGAFLSETLPRISEAMKRQEWTRI